MSVATRCQHGSRSVAALLWLLASAAAAAGAPAPQEPLPSDNASCPSPSPPSTLSNFAETAKSDRLLAPDLRHERLDNGLTVSILADSNLPVVATQVWYHVGSANEAEDSRGFAHLFEHLMFGGSANFAKDELIRHHTRAGGSWNGYTSLDETVYLSALAALDPLAPTGLDQVLAMEADRMAHLNLTEENLANEKRIVTEELRLRIQNNPLTRVGTSVQGAVLAGHPYAVSPVGTEEDIERATLAGARRFYQSLYGPGNAHVVIVGPVDAAATMHKVQQSLGAVPARGAPPPEIPDVYGWELRREVSFTEDLPPVKVAAMAFPLPTDAASREAVRVLYQLLAGSAVDPFEEELVRSRRKAVFAMTEGLFFRRGNVLAFAAAYLPYRREATAFRLIEETLASMSRLEWLTDETVAAAKRALLMEDLERRYFAADMARAIGTAHWHYGDVRYALEQSERIREVTRADVMTLWQRHIGEAEGVRVFLKPEHVPWYIAAFGWLYPLFAP